MHGVSFIMILSDCSRFIHWHKPLLSEVVNKSKTVGSLRQELYFCSIFAFDTKTLGILLINGFWMTVQYK